MKNTPEQAKSRAARIALTYYSRPDRFSRARPYIAGLACVIAFFVVAISLFLNSPQEARTRRLRLVEIASPGKVAQAHALWESKCEVCHRPGVAMNPDRTASMFRHSDQGRSRCLDCHSANSHHANLKVGLGQNCAECHQDHRGRLADLKVVADSHCISCHQNLAVTQSGPNRRSNAAITAFDPDEHPEFFAHRAPKTDASTFTFDHALHLAPGQNPNGEGLIRFENLPEKDRSRYGMRDESQLKDVVTLNCRSCHEAQFAENSSANPNIDDSGTDSFPVRFEASCAACHPLSVGESNRRLLTARHGLSVDETLDGLRRTYLEETLLRNPKLLDRKVSSVTIPGKAIESIDPQLKKAIDDEVEKAAELLLGKSWRTSGPNGKRGCVECHAFDGSRLPESLTIRPVSAGRIGLGAVKFDHGKHKIIDCDSCHAAATSTRASDNLLPRIRTCISCHGEKGLSDQVSASAGNTCVTCHDFHAKHEHSELGKASDDRPAMHSEFRKFLQK
jgi:hypothetical protein